MCENCPLYSKCMDAVDVCSCVSRYYEIFHERCDVMKKLCTLATNTPSKRLTSLPSQFGQKMVAFQNAKPIQWQD